MKRNMLAFALSIAAHAFEDKLYNGKPYFLHIMRVVVALEGEDEEVLQAGALHDIVEDHFWTIEDLRKEGFSERVLSAVQHLTWDKDGGETYENYIKRVSNNKDAIKVKRKDLEDNSQITRIKGLTKQDFERLEKYSKAYVYLSKT